MQGTAPAQSAATGVCTGRPGLLLAPVLHHDEGSAAALAAHRPGVGCSAWRQPLCAWPSARFPPAAMQHSLAHPQVWGLRPHRAVLHIVGCAPACRLMRLRRCWRWPLPQVSQNIGSLACACFALGLGKPAYTQVSSACPRTRQGAQPAQCGRGCEPPLKPPPRTPIPSAAAAPTTSPSTASSPSAATSGRGRAWGREDARWSGSGARDPGCLGSSGCLVCQRPAAARSPAASTAPRCSPPSARCNGRGHFAFECPAP